MRLLIGNKNYSSWSMRPWLLMQHANIDFDEIRIPLFTDEGDQQLASLSPSGMVPVLLDTQYTVWDSLAICETIADLYPEKNLWPNDSQTKALARAASCEMHSGFAALRSELPMNCRVTQKTPALSPAALCDIERVNTLLTELLATDPRGNNSTNGAHWLHGTDYTITDAMFAPVISRFNTFQIDCPAPVKAYATRVLNDPPMKTWYAAARSEPEVIEQAEIKV